MLYLQPGSVDSCSICMNDGRVCQLLTDTATRLDCQTRASTLPVCSQQATGSSPATHELIHAPSAQARTSVMNGEHVIEVLRPMVVCDPPQPTPPPLVMHYPQLMSTTCVSTGMIAMDAVVGDWPGGSAPLQPCQHCWMNCRTRSLSACRRVWRAAAMLPRQPCLRSRGGRSGHPTALRTGRSRFSGDTVADHHYPWRVVWSAAAWLPRQPCLQFGAWYTVPHPGHEIAECARADQRVGQTCMRSLRVDGYVARDSYPRPREHLQPGLTQRDLWVMHSCDSGSVTGGYRAVHQGRWLQLPRYHCPQ